MSDTVDIVVCTICGIVLLIIPVIFFARYFNILFLFTMYLAIFIIGLVYIILYTKDKRQNYLYFSIFLLIPSISSILLILFIFLKQKILKNKI